MLKYVIKRFLQMIVMLFALSVILFLMVRLIPGDPVTMMLGKALAPRRLPPSVLAWGWTIRSRSST